MGKFGIKTFTQFQSEGKRIEQSRQDKWTL